MSAVAIVSADPALRRRLERAGREEPALSIVGIADQSAFLEMAGRDDIDVVVADLPSRQQLLDWRTRCGRTILLVLVGEAEEQGSLEALDAGASAVLLRSAAATDIVAAIKAAASGLVVLQPKLVSTLLGEASLVDPAIEGTTAGATLTSREREVLRAMADGASNKAIARRLGISFHTVKFHVAAILAKLDADSRTEAVMKGAQLGLVML
jgi:DNA-binding NarL/FixJ family response regulator